MTENGAVPLQVPMPTELVYLVFIPSHSWHVHLLSGKILHSKGMLNAIGMI